jgi:hypothetical protein
VLKLVLGKLSASEYVDALDRGLEVSHLTGISDDANPLNHVLEDRATNLDRKHCHHTSNLSASTEPVCRNHTEACFLAGSRKQGSWPKVINEMIKENAAGRPAINAFDLVSHVLVRDGKGARYILAVARLKSQ